MKNGIYARFQRLTKDKDKATAFMIENTLQKTVSMFHYSNLPPTIPPREIESILQRKGYCVIADVNGDLYALYGGLGGAQNAYYKPTICTVANPYLDLIKDYVIENDKDAVLVKNDFLCSGLLPIIGKYAVPLVDVHISLNAAAVLSRLQLVISASDDLTKKSAEVFIEKMLNGDFSVIAENAFLKGVNVQNVDYPLIIKDLIELTQYYKSNLLSEIGLNSTFNMKRERLTENEVLLDNSELLPFVENMLFERQTAIQRVNEKYGTDIKVDLSSVWKTNKETNEKAAATENTETEMEHTETETNETETDETETEKIVQIIRDMRENETEKKNENV